MVWGLIMQAIRCPQCGADFGDDLGVNAFREMVTRCGSCDTIYETRVTELTPVDETPGKAIVPYLIVRCPHCDSEDTFINGTNRPVRYHRCRSCNNPFQSLECTYDHNKHDLCFRK